MKKIMVLFLVLALAVGAAPPIGSSAAEFSDVPRAHWAYEAIQEMADAEVIHGSGGRFAPDKTLTGQMFLTLLGRLLFPELEVKKGETWYGPYVAAAQEAGWLDGTRITPENTKAAITRYDMAVILAKASKTAGLSAPAADTSKIADYEAIPEEYRPAVESVFAQGLIPIEDDGKFNGDATMTRAQAAVVVWRLKKLQDKALADFLAILGSLPSVPEDYTSTVKTGGELEAKYMAMGSHEVSYMESAAMMSFKKYEVFYPSDISSMSGSLPAVVFVNGTGVAGSKYQALQKHLASWGFITIATEEEYAWNGFSAEMCVRYLELLNLVGAEVDGEKNVFQGKIDLDRIGITGHSQGGFGVVNAITGHRHADSYKAAVILSCGDTTWSLFQWEADATKIAAPTLIFSSTGNGDASIASLESIQKLYGNIPDDVTKLLARRNEGDHGEMLYYGDGYVTAWFMYYLNGDEKAGEAFFGKDAEILSNANWQDIMINP